MISNEKFKWKMKTESILYAQQFSSDSVKEITKVFILKKYNMNSVRYLKA